MTKLLSLATDYWYLLVIALLVGLLGVQELRVQSAKTATVEAERKTSKVQEDWARQVAASKTKALETAELYRETERLRSQNNARVQDDLQRQAKQLLAANAGLRGDRDRLLSLLSTGPSSGSCAAATNPEAAQRVDAFTRAARDVSAACAERYAAMAEEAGDLARQVIGLQRYVTQVCLLPVGGDADSLGPSPYQGIPHTPPGSEQESTSFLTPTTALPTD